MNNSIQRASMLKRIPAWMLDAILLIVVATGLIAALAAVLDVNASMKQLNAVYDRYEAEYDIDFGKTQEELEAMTKEEIARYEAAAEAFSKDKEAEKAFGMLLSLSLITLSLGILGAYVILELLIPLWLRNGQTIGKKVFGVALMRKDGVKVTGFMMFARTILGKYTMETMIPVLLIVGIFFNVLGLDGLIIIGLILLLQVIITLATHNKTAIHDLLACTVAVDLSSQMIFDSPEELVEYNKRLHAEMAQKADY